MVRFWKKRPEQLQRVDAARDALSRHGEPRPVIGFALDKVERAIETALHERAELDASIQDFDADVIAADLKHALRQKPEPAAPDDEHILALRRRHPAVHALMNRRDSIDTTIAKTLADLDTLAAETATAAIAEGDAIQDVDHWLAVLDADAQAILAANAIAPPSVDLGDS